MFTWRSPNASQTLPHGRKCARVDKKLSYPQRKRASNMAILYGADGISIWNRIGIDHECDKQTAYVPSVAPSAESIQNTKFDTQQR